MRFVVLSDTHGDLSKMFGAVEYIQALKPDALIHLGDYVSDAQLMQQQLRIPLYSVAGNCDVGRTTRPAADVIDAQGARILICHGHNLGVKDGLDRLCYAAQERECAAALFGHTHCQYMERSDGLLLMNPGSLTRPRGSQAGLGLITVQEGNIKGIVLPYHTRM